MVTADVTVEPAEQPEVAEPTVAPLPALAREGRLVAEYPRVRELRIRGRKVSSCPSLGSMEST